MISVRDGELRNWCQVEGARYVSDIDDYGQIRQRIAQLRTRGTELRLRGAALEAQAEELEAQLPAPVSRAGRKARLVSLPGRASALAPLALLRPRRVASAVLSHPAAATATVGAVMSGAALAVVPMLVTSPAPGPTAQHTTAPHHAAVRHTPTVAPTHTPTTKPPLAPAESVHLTDAPQPQPRHSARPQHRRPAGAPLVSVVAVPQRPPAVSVSIPTPTPTPAPAPPSRSRHGRRCLRLVVVSLCVH